MNSILWRLTLKLKRKSYFAQIVLFFAASLISYLFVLPFIFMIDQLIGENSNGPDLDWWVVVIILGPILETYLFQHLPFKLLQKWNLTKRKYGIYIVITTIVFSLLHCYSLQYIIAVIPGGIILAYVYVFYCKSMRKAFWSTTIIHSLRNSVAVFAFVFEK